jgi:MbtH protein
MTDETVSGTYLVVINHEDQYSIWFSDQDMPAGWIPEGTQGTRQECLDHIDSVWTDMRPRSLRKQMNACAPTHKDQGSARDHESTR